MRLQRSYESLNPFQTSPAFYVSQYKSVSKALWEKEKLLVTSNFSFSYSVFNPFGELSGNYMKFTIAVCKFLSFRKSVQFVVSVRVKTLIRCNPFTTLK